jgi:penicillin amidase
MQNQTALNMYLPFPNQAFMKTIRYVVITLAVLALLPVLAFLALYVKHKPSYTGEKSLKTLSSPVSVTYDKNGIPHIYGTSNEDAFHALGYIHAKDRLFQMDVLRRIGSGRLAAFFGEDLVKVDRFFRTLGTHRLAEESVRQVFEIEQDQAYVKLAAAYINGINAYIQTGEASAEYTFLGLDPEPFTVTDLHYTVAYMSYSFAIALQEDPLVNNMYALGPEYAAALEEHYDASYFHTLPNTYNSDSATADSAIMATLREVLNSLPAPAFLGSNSWVISGKKTKSGKPIFANDTHIGFSQPSVWYEAHVKTPELDLYGNFLAGFPFPLVGHTREHAWGLTMFENDDMDLYAEDIKGDSVLYKGNYVALSTREEVIQVKDGESQSFTVRETPHGPIISDAHDLAGSVGEPLSVFWTLTQFPLRAPEVAYGFAFANSLNEFEANLEKLHAPGLNVMYGDEAGNIAWWATAKLLKRPKHVNSKRILDGASGKDEPLGWYAFKDNPHAVNPERGFVHSANNQPDSLAVDSLWYPGYYYHGSRSQAIETALEVKDDWDVASTQALLLNHESPTYPGNVRLLLENLEPSNELEAVAWQTLMNWKGTHAKEESAPILYYALTYFVLEGAMSDELDPLYFKEFIHSFYRLRSFPKFIRDSNSPWWDNVNTSKTETREEIVAQAFSKAVDAVATRYGNSPADWRWGDAHHVTHEHPLGKVSPLDMLFNVGPFEAESGEEVINKLSFNLNPEVSFKVKAGPAMRIALDFADVDAAVSINPTGNSGMVFTDWYRNQAEMYVNGEFRPMHMDTAMIEKPTRMQLLPK